MRNFQRLTKKVPHVVNSEGGITRDPKKQTEILEIEVHQKECSLQRKQNKVKIYCQKMRTKYTEEEVTQAVKSLKINKSTGIDNIRAEHLKNAPAGSYSMPEDRSNTKPNRSNWKVPPRNQDSDFPPPLRKPGKRK